MARVLPGAAGAIKDRPGATTSGFAKPSNQEGPRELKGSMRSSALMTVLRGFIEPTVMADGALPGEAMPP